ncbi:helix-turn-helix domain-containing protein [Paraburkholderia tagetis]|uniref:Helix-turn-helix domain-containing protein n=1 Tax=Paraburkholderia tagetis TaxID=2913261 RepID=A0A9X1UP83_9BURK|nr:helix-turn-helix transcriptional regulator [Paraburkholderia tagetis]MCG5078787.1 helix-turn-helix domain-containing protein [Paraburkholderia tagetis]
MGRLADLRNELMTDPEFRAGYEQQGQLVRFGRIMRGARESQGLTQAQLASRLEISQSEISRLEKGEGVNGPTFERLVAFAHALGLRFVVGFADEQPVEMPRPGRTGVMPPPVFGGFRLRRHPGGSTVTAEIAADDREALWGAF